MIRTLCLNTSSKDFEDDIPVSKISDYRLDPNNVIWADISDPTSEDFLELAEEFDFHPLAIEDCQKEHQRPKVDEYEGYYFIVLYEPTLGEEGRLELREIDVFLGPNFLVTVHAQPIRAIETTKRLWQEWRDVAEQRAGLLGYLLMDTVVDDYLPMLDTLSEDVDTLEDKIFGDFDPKAIHSIFHTKKQLLYLRRAIGPLRDVFNKLLRREQPIFERATYAYFQDVFDHILRVTDTIDTLRDIIGSTMDAYLTVNGNRMNVVMKRLTAVATILMSVTLISSVFGMNFHYMPELSWRYGYVFALCMMVALGTALYIYMRRIKWL